MTRGRRRWSQGRLVARTPIRALAQKPISLFRKASIYSILVHGGGVCGLLECDAPPVASVAPARRPLLASSSGERVRLFSATGDQARFSIGARQPARVRRARPPHRCTAAGRATEMFAHALDACLAAGERLLPDACSSVPVLHEQSGVCAARVM